MSITLSNFQAHEKLELDFSPSITTIKGPTDAGKSAILRALRWVSLNDLAGDEFIREGSRRTCAILVVREKGEQSTITRSKGASHLNSYELEDVGEFKAFGTSVPSQIADLLRISELNFQGQHDGPFWFCESSAEVSRQLNSIVDLSVIDTSLSNIASAVRSAQERKNVCLERLEGAKMELEKIEDAAERIAAFTQLRGTDERKCKTEKRRNLLEGLVQDYHTNRNWFRDQEERSKHGTSVLSAGKEWHKQTERVARLNELVGRITHYRSKPVPPPFEPVEQAYNAWHKAEEKHNELANLLSNMDKIRNGLVARQEAADKAERRFHRETKGKACPMCGAIQ